jgi:hypothetical protein
MKKFLALSFMALALGVHAEAPYERETNPNKIPHRLNPGHATSEAATAGSTGQQTPVITSYGGPVVGNQPNIHLIWYGNWAQTNGSDNAAGQNIVRDFIFGDSGSSYLALNVGYTGSGGTSVTGYLGTVYEPSAPVGYSHGKRLSDSTIATIVSDYITKEGRNDPNAIYLVLTSSDVAETSGFCTKYCGWHTSGAVSSAFPKIRYGFIGNANRCLSACAAQTTSPNSNAGVDGMVSVVAHEVEETLTDPDANGWHDSSGAENADKCAWTFGSAQFQVANGSFANVTLPARAGGTRNYLIQRNLKTDSKCYISSNPLQQ